jgi:DNA-binding XRE family transcriptional regulator
MKNQPVDFASLLWQIESFKSLKRVAEDIGASYSHLMNIKNGARGEPSYSLGVRIIKYHQVTIEDKFTHLKARMKNGWQT